MMFRWLALVLLAGCTSPLGQVCNPRGECADVIASTNFPKYDDYVTYVPSNVTVVDVLIIDRSQGVARVQY